jgi:diguanylate cyclase (GGDEF)-like protein
MRILYADDSQTSRRTVGDLLRSMGHEVVEATDGRQLIEAFRERIPDLVMLDVDMPRMNGYDAAREIRLMCGAADWIPIMFLSGKVDDADVATGILAGGDDYLTKPVGPQVLRAKIQAMQRITDMRQRLVNVTRELAASNRALQELSSRDGMTGISNRREFDVAIEREWNHAQRGRSPLGLILCDIDHFKAYNDTYGHQLGDDCLRAIAQALQGTVRRKVDLAARYGGEEFALLLPDTAPVSALLMAGRALEAVRSLGIPHAGSPRGHVTASLGVVSAVPKASELPSQLVAAADRALYEAKTKGRNQAVMHALHAK